MKWGQYNLLALQMLREGDLCARDLLGTPRSRKNMGCHSHWHKTLQASSAFGGNRRSIERACAAIGSNGLQGGISRHRQDRPLSGSSGEVGLQGTP